MLVNCATRLELRHFVAKLQFKSNEAWINKGQDAEWSVKSPGEGGTLRGNNL